MAERGLHQVPEWDNLLRSINKAMVNRRIVQQWLSNIILTPSICACAGELYSHPFPKKLSANFCHGAKRLSYFQRKQRWTFPVNAHSKPLAPDELRTQVLPIHLVQGFNVTMGTAPVTSALWNRKDEDWIDICDGGHFESCTEQS